VLSRAEGRPAAALPAVAMLPFGTGNVAVHAFSIPRRLEAALDAVARGRSRELDVGVVAKEAQPGSSFVLWLGAGLDGALIHAVAKARSGPIAAGILHYVAPALRAYWRYPFPLIEPELDGVRQPACAEVILANVGGYAVVGNVAPEADPSDGLLDVVCVGPRSRLGWIAPALATLTGRLESCRGVRIVRCRRVRLTAPAAVPVQSDGEATGMLPLEAEVRPRAIRLLVT
jgi:diacylglycerol kinase (ATP)